MTNKFLDCYYRVSTKGQKEEGYSLDSQIEISQRVAKQLKLKVRPHNEFSKVMQLSKESNETSLRKSKHSLNKRKLKTYGLLNKKDYSENLLTHFSLKNIT